MDETVTSIIEVGITDSVTKDCQTAIKLVIKSNTNREGKADLLNRIFQLVENLVVRQFLLTLVN